MGRAKQPILAESGASGLIVSRDGRVLEEWLPQLSGSKAAQIYREMSDNDASISAAMYLLEMMVKQVDWSINASEPTESAEFAAEFVDECRQDMDNTWADFISEIMTMCIYGWAFFEVNYKYRRGSVDNRYFESKYDDGRVGWRSLAIRGQDSLDRWDLDEDGTILGMWQRPAPSYLMRYIPIEKALLFRTRTHKNNPEGRSKKRQ
jgi:hypothetical protein